MWVSNIYLLLFSHCTIIACAYYMLEIASCFIMNKTKKILVYICLIFDIIIKTNNLKRKMMLKITNKKPNWTPFFLHRTCWSAGPSSLHWWYESNDPNFPGSALSAVQYCFMAPLDPKEIALHLLRLDPSNNYLFFSNLADIWKGT